MSALRDPSTTYEGKHACPVCGSTEKYKDRHDCAPCHRARTNAARAKKAALKRARTVMALPEKGERTRKFVPAPVVKTTKAEPFAGVLITRLPARFLCLVPGNGQKFAVEGFTQDHLWCWDEAQVPGLCHGAPGEMRWAINPAIAAEPNWYFVPSPAEVAP